MSETFIDSTVVEIPHAATWKTLSYMQLLDVKTKLITKLETAKSMKLDRGYTDAISLGIEKAEALLMVKLNDPFGRLS